MSELLYLLDAVGGNFRLPVTVQSSQGECRFLAGAKLICSSQGGVVQGEIGGLRLVFLKRFYPSYHETVVQRLEIRVGDSLTVVMEREMIVGWSGQGGMPSSPWTDLRDLARFLSLSYGIALEELGSWDSEFQPARQETSYGTPPGL